jgi:hypothetical protein
MVIIRPSASARREGVAAAIRAAAGGVGCHTAQHEFGPADEVVVERRRVGQPQVTGGDVHEPGQVRGQGALVVEEDFPELLAGKLAKPTARRHRGSAATASRARGGRSLGRRPAARGKRRGGRSVAVNRCGRGSAMAPGYSDIEVALLAEAGLIRPETVIVTTVRQLQVVDEELPETKHDFSVDVIVTPEERSVVSCRGVRRASCWSSSTPRERVAFPS